MGELVELVVDSEVNQTRFLASRGADVVVVVEGCVVVVLRVGVWLVALNVNHTRFFALRDARWVSGWGLAVDLEVNQTRFLLCVMLVRGG